MITQRNVDVGDLHPAREPGPAPLHVARDDLVRIIVGVPEMYAAAVNPGDHVQIRLQALDGQGDRGQGRPDFLVPRPQDPDPPHRDRPSQPLGTLRPGLYAQATVIVEEHRDALTVPTTAPVRQDARAYCIAVVDGRAVRKPVTPGLDDGSQVEILSGLQGDEAIVKAGATSSRGRAAPDGDGPRSPMSPEVNRTDGLSG